MRRPAETPTTQIDLFPRGFELPGTLPVIESLRPSGSLLRIFAACHNHIYANEGLLKDRIFQELVKLLFMKLVDESRAATEPVRFGITSDEYRQIYGDASADFLRRMRGLYSEVKLRYSPFFENDNGLLLKPQTLAFVVAKLQNISLTHTPLDVKGEAFQAFVYRNMRGDRGEFFTPAPVVRLAVAMIEPRPGEMVLDPAAGSGGFLIEAIRSIRNMHEDIRGRPTSEGFVRSSVRGVEFNPDVARAASLRLAFEGGSGDEILCRNSLTEEVEDLLGTADVILTNPPFGARGRIEDPGLLRHFELGHRWHRVDDGKWGKTTSLQRSQSPEILFLERSIDLLKPGGRMAIVLPDGLLQNPSADHVRAWLAELTSLSAVVSLPQETFIPYGTGIKTSLLVLQKKHPGREEEERRVFFARILRIGYDVKGQPTYRKDARGQIGRDANGTEIVDSDVDAAIAAYRAFQRKDVHNKGDHFFSHPASLLDSRLDAEHYLPSDLAILSTLKRQGARPLEELAEIVRTRESLRPQAEVRYIAISDIDARSMRIINQQRMRASELPSRASYRVREGDILTATSGASTGTPKHVSAIVTESEDGAVCSNGLAVIRRVRHVDPYFLLAYLRSEPFLRQVRRLMTGHAIPAISNDQLGRVLVPVPDEDVEAAVSRQVSKAQRLRDEAQALTDQAIGLVRGTQNP